MKRKFLIFAMVLLLTPLFPFNRTDAASPVKLWVNGNYVTTDADPYIEKGRTMVPIRVISENLGYEVSWTPEEQKVAIFKPEFAETGFGIILYINNPVVGLYEDEEIKLDAPPKIINGRTFVPIRFIAETMGLKVNWDNANRTVIIGDGYVNNEKSQPENAVTVTNNVTEDKNTNLGILPTGWQDPKDPAYKYANGKIIGNVKSNIYHFPDQKSYKKVSVKNAIFFNSAKDAEKSGFRNAQN